MGFIQHQSNILGDRIAFCLLDEIADKEIGDDVADTGDFERDDEVGTEEDSSHREASNPVSEGGEG